MVDSLLSSLVEFVDILGYFGVYFYMLLVGTFIPVPSEIVLLPAGYLASQGEKNLYLLILAGSLGSISGALINYYFAKKIVKSILKNKRMFIAKVIVFFRSHGKISAFVGPLTPGLGQYISLPAGISHMKLRYFIPLTYAANIIWVSFMLMIGYMFGADNEASHTKAIQGSMILFGFVIVFSSLYVWREVKKKNNKEIDPTSE